MTETKSNAFEWEFYGFSGALDVIESRQLSIIKKQNEHLGWLAGILCSSASELRYCYFGTDGKVIDVPLTMISEGSTVEEAVMHWVRAYAESNPAQK